jgi:hypothetical protein
VCILRHLATEGLKKNFFATEGLKIRD